MKRNKYVTSLEPLCLTSSGVALCIVNHNLWLWSGHPIVIGIRLHAWNLVLEFQVFFEVFPLHFYQAWLEEDLHQGVRTPSEFVALKVHMWVQVSCGHFQSAIIPVPRVLHMAIAMAIAMAWARFYSKTKTKFINTVIFPNRRLNL